MAVAQRFSENLLILRRRAGLSQEQLGFDADLHRTEIGCLERGERNPRIDTLVKIAGALEVDPGELLAGLVWLPGSARHGNFRGPDEAN